MDEDRIEIDDDFKILIDELNRVGLVTTQCCSGHGGTAYLSFDMRRMKDVAVRMIDGYPRLVIWWDRKEEEGMKVCCYDCGRPYESFDLDVIVPNGQWKKICPVPYDGEGGGGLLCPDCIVKRGSKIPGVTVAHLIFDAV